MKEIKLANDKGIALVDDEDYEMLSQYKWHFGNRKHIITNVYINKKRTSKQMHHFLINIPKGYVADHIDRNPLNNQKENLRIATYSQNRMNTSKRKNTFSNFKGVSWHKQHNKWIAQIGKNNKVYYLGLFENEIDAAKEYDRKAIELFKEFAVLNEV